MLTNRMKPAREATGLTQNDLSEAMGLRRVALSRYETGKHVPGVALHQKSGSDTRSGSSILNKPPLLVVACNFGAKPPGVYTAIEMVRALGTTVEALFGKGDTDHAA